MGETGKVIKNEYYKNPEIFNNLLEIRIRCANPIQLKTSTENIFLAHKPQSTEIDRIVTSLCSNSVYAYEKSIKDGFVTIKGGHRVGLAGRYVTDKGILTIGSINIRVAGEIKGSCKCVLPEIMKPDGDVYNSLIVSPPGCGKTTLLRDIARVLSYQNISVGIVDERSEVAACFMGVPCNDLGPCCDVYDACPKDIGIYMMLRAMSPYVIVTDEVGNEKDVIALKQAVTAGVRLIATCHGASEKDVLEKGLKGIFQRIVILSSGKGPGTVERVIKYG
ncbi:MAG: stage III sporulation protein AA [Ruminococcaceae bacterium]|nr:stage III sporulation protein AA [Oscillospiraceae bacterium]